MLKRKRPVLLHPHRRRQVVLELDHVARGAVVVDHRRGRGHERLGDRDRAAPRALALEHRVALALQREAGQVVVGLAVAAASGRHLRRSVPLRDGVGEGRVEVGRADLERVAERAGRVVGPVLGRAGRVVEAVGRLVDVAVLARHLRAEALEDLLVDRRALRGDSRRPQDEAGEGVVGDERGDLTVRDQRADVPRLRLRERAGAAVVLRGGHRARAGAAPEAAVVAVRVDARLLQPDRGLHAAAGLAVVEEAAVLAPVLVRVADDVDRLLGVVAAAAAGRALELARLAGGVEAVGVDDRDDDRPRLGDEAGGALVALLHPVDQLIGPLERVLAGRPLAGVMDAELHEDRLAVVVRLDVPGDLDPLDHAALVGLLRQREDAHHLRVLGGQRLHLLAVVEEAPVGAGPAAREAVRRPAGSGRTCESACFVSVRSSTRVVKGRPSLASSSRSPPP